jgi:hypothetical protein
MLRLQWATEQKTKPLVLQCWGAMLGSLMGEVYYMHFQVTMALLECNPKVRGICILFLSGCRGCDLLGVWHSTLLGCCQAVCLLCYHFSLLLLPYCHFLLPQAAVVMCAACILTYVCLENVENGWRFLKLLIMYW